jgi:hypothetical protein
MKLSAFCHRPYGGILRGGKGQGGAPLRSLTPSF